MQNIYEVIHTKRGTGFKKRPVHIVPFQFVPTPLPCVVARAWTVSVVEQNTACVTLSLQ